MRNLRDLSARARRLGSVRGLAAEQAGADSAAWRQHCYSRLVHFASGDQGPPPELAADVAQRLRARGAGPFQRLTNADREAVLARLRHLVATVDCRKLPPGSDRS